MCSGLPSVCVSATLQGMDEGGLDYALNRAIDAYYNDKPWFRSLQVRPTTQAAPLQCAAGIGCAVVSPTAGQDPLMMSTHQCGSLRVPTLVRPSTPIHGFLSCISGVSTDLPGLSSVLTTSHVLCFPPSVLAPPTHPTHTHIQARIMRQDWSWNRPALDYVELYYSTTKS
jgi:hypothetical protein